MPSIYTHNRYPSTPNSNLTCSPFISSDNQMTSPAQSHPPSYRDHYHGYHATQLTSLVSQKAVQQQKRATNPTSNTHTLSNHPSHTTPSSPLVPKRTASPVHVPPSNLPIKSNHPGPQLPFPLLHKQDVLYITTDPTTSLRHYYKMKISVPDLVQPRLCSYCPKARNRS